MYSVQAAKMARRTSTYTGDAFSAKQEAQTLRAAQNGDHAALTALLARHEAGLYAVCFGMLGQTQDAEDAVQETFLNALRALPRFRGASQFKTWLFRIGVNACLDLLRARRPTQAWEEASVAAFHASPETQLLGQWRIQEALARLLPHRRAIFLLKEQAGWSVAEISAALQRPRHQIYYELREAHRALAQWRDESRQGDDQ